MPEITSSSGRHKACSDHLPLLAVFRQLALQTADLFLAFGIAEEFALTGGVHAGDALTGLQPPQLVACLTAETFPFSIFLCFDLCLLLGFGRRRTTGAELGLRVAGGRIGHRLACRAGGRFRCDRSRFCCRGGGRRRMLLRCCATQGLHRPARGWGVRIVGATVLIFPLIDLCRDRQGERNSEQHQGGAQQHEILLEGFVSVAGK